MRARALSLVLVLVGLSLACRRPAEPVNIVLISIDSLRADHVGAYGYAPRTSPTLDRLAADGALFENSVAESSWTLPTHITMLTGLSTLAHGVDHFVGSRLEESVTTLAERLRDAGYVTLGVYSGPYLHPYFGFGKGFETYLGVLEELPAAEQPSYTGGSEIEQRIMAANARSHRSITSPEITERAINFLHAFGDKRFFLFLHYFDVHYDYIPPEDLWRKFDPDYEGTVTGEKYNRNSAIHPDMDAEDLRHVIALYDAEILYTDRYIGRFVDALDAAGLSDETLIVVTSDHGDEFFEHGNKGHARTLYDEVILVPLIARLPGRIPAGLRVSEQVRHLDIAPTLLSFAGLEVDLEGEDLREPLTAGGGFPSPGAVSTLRRNGHWLSLRVPGIKYLVHREASSVTERVHDLRRDPGEQQPVFRTGEVGRPYVPDRRIDELRARLHREELAAQVLRDHVDDSAHRDAELPEGLMEQLRSLGYLSAPSKAGEP